MVLLLILPLLFFAQVADASEAEVRAMERHVLMNIPRHNYMANAEFIESTHGIKEYKDGKWTCQDRAEVMGRVLSRRGYTWRYAYEKTDNPKILHQVIVVVEDSKPIVVLSNQR